VGLLLEVAYSTIHIIDLWGARKLEGGIKILEKFNGGLFGNFSNALFDICLILQGVWVGKDF